MDPDALIEYLKDFGFSMTKLASGCIRRGSQSLPVKRQRRGSKEVGISLRRSHPLRAAFFRKAHHLAAQESARAGPSDHDGTLHPISRGAGRSACR